MNTPQITRRFAQLLYGKMFMGGLALNPSRAVFSRVVELQTAAYLRHLGYKNVRIRVHKGYDISALHPVTGEFLRFEVKGSRLGKDGKYRATTLKQGKYGKTDYRKSDYILFSCVDLCGTFTTFVIPVQGFNKNQIVIANRDPEAYNGVYAEYREQWALIV